MGKKKGNKKARKITNRQAKIARKKKTQVDRFKNLKAKVRNTFQDQGLPTDRMKFIEPPDGIKMSAVILKIAEPLIQKHGDSDERIEAIISLTILEWNNSLLPEGEQEKFHAKTIDHIIPSNGSAEDVASLIYIGDLITERKNKYFPDINKIVVNYDLEVSNGDITLNVSSAPIEAMQLKQ
jgi:hypothetical protein